MTTTITKRAGELKPGDIVILAETRVVLLKHMGITGDREHIFKACRIGGTETDTRYFLQDGEESWQVEAPGAPAMTPAQQHAEELLEMVRRVNEGMPAQAKWRVDSEKLLAQIDPPQPPTLEEALTALAQVTETTGHVNDKMREAARPIIARARRAKIIP